MIGTVEAQITRRGALAGLASVTLAGCSSTRASHARPTLDVATFNIWHDAGGQWPTRLGLITAALRRTNADVIALQEVLEDSARALPNQARTIADALGFPGLEFVATEPEGAPRRYGNAILTRLPIIEVARRKLVPLDDYRTAIRVRVQTASGPVDVVNTHLAWKPEQGPTRAEQLADLLGWLPQGGTPLIIMGDFNAPLDDAGLVSMGPPRFESALRAGAAATTLNTACGHQPRVIDHIFAEREHFAALGAEVIGNEPVDGEYPSDHFGVVARLARK